MEMRIEPPAVNEVAELAKKLLAKDNPLDLQVLFSLLGEPKRYRDLKPLLAGKRDHNFTVALERLQDDGLVARRTNARQDPPVHTYRITPLGIQTVLHADTIRTLDEARERLVGA